MLEDSLICYVTDMTVDCYSVGSLIADNSLEFLHAWIHDFVCDPLLYLKILQNFYHMLVLPNLNPPMLLTRYLGSNNQFNDR